MPKKSLPLFFFVLFVCILFFTLILMSSPIPTATEENGSATLSNKVSNTLNKGGFGQLRYNDWSPWLAETTTTAFTKSGQIYACNSKNVGSGALTLILAINYTLHNSMKVVDLNFYHIYLRFTEGSALYGMQCYYIFKFTYNDSSTTTLQSETFSWFEAAKTTAREFWNRIYYVTQGKFATKFSMELWMRKLSGPADTLTAEIYIYPFFKVLGSRPYLQNFTINSDVIHVQTGSLYIDCLPKNITSAPLSNITYVPTAGQQHFPMVFWYNNLWECVQTLPYTGFYIVQILCTNEWGTWNLGLLTVLASAFTFPALAELAVYSSLDGWGLESSMFKYYLGVDDEYSLVDFLTYFGNWSVLNNNTLSASFIDNYITFNTSNNGLATYFQNNTAVYTVTYNTLLFEVEASQQCAIRIIYNPLFNQRDYTVNITQGETWYHIILPIFNFNFYHPGDYLFQLGFKLIGNGTLNLVNIRLAKYYDFNGSAYIPNSYRLINSANRQSANNLTFTQAQETLAICDFFGNVLYRQLVNYEAYIDIGMPIETVCFINDYPFPIILTVNRGFGVQISNVLPAHSSWSVRLFATEYSVYVRNLQMKVLDLTKIVGNNSSLVTIIIGTTQTFTLTAIELVLLYVLIATAICGILVNLYFRFKDKRAAELERKRTAHEKDVKAILKGFETKRVRPK
jgi:hypothetical protein